MIKKLVKNEIDYILKKSPKYIFKIIYKKYHKEKNDILQKYELYRYSYKFNKDTFDINNKEIEYCIINKGAWEYRIFNICFLNNMLGNIIYILSNNKVPVIDVKNKMSNENIWELFLEQPFISKAENIDKSDNITTCDIDESIFHPNFDSIYKKDELKIWCKIYKEFVIFNKNTKEYIDNEYNTLISKDKKVLGVLCRGTDYTSLKPKWHPIQPAVEDVIELAKEKMKELNLEYIYLATEEKRIEEKFKESFPGKIITNKRNYYDDKYYSNKDINIIAQVHFDRENDDYYKGLEYISSLTILSRCNALIAGNCGGTCAAIYMNNMMYEYTHVFDLGLYGIDDV